jgi:hypothetical protein
MEALNKMKTGYKSKVKSLRGFTIRVTSSLNGKHFWMCIGTTDGSYEAESAVVRYPNWVERLFGVTPESKLLRHEKQMLAALRRKTQRGDERVVKAIDNFLGNE